MVFNSHIGMEGGGEEKRRGVEVCSVKSEKRVTEGLC